MKTATALCAKTFNWGAHSTTSPLSFLAFGRCACKFFFSDHINGRLICSSTSATAAISSGDSFEKEPKAMYSTDEGFWVSSHGRQMSVSGTGGGGDIRLNGPTLRKFLKLDFRLVFSGGSNSSKLFIKTASACGSFRPI